MGYNKQRVEFGLGELKVKYGFTKSWKAKFGGGLYQLHHTVGAKILHIWLLPLRWKKL